MKLMKHRLGSALPLVCVCLVVSAVMSFLWLTHRSLKSVASLPRNRSVLIESVSSKPAEPTGALIDVRMRSQVGIVLDEIPRKERLPLVQDLLQKPAPYWINRATKQVRFTTLRRNYGIKYGKAPLPLPPEELWQVRLAGVPHRTTVDGHDAVVVEYTYQSTLLSDLTSPAVSEPVLGTIGGKWEDSLILPLDPEFVFQRTRFACMNESESPPNSIDAEEADFYYDQKCHVEAKLTNIGCHQAEMPTQSCEEAVVAHIGAARPQMVFERLPWDEALASRVRRGTITNLVGPDLQPIQSRFMEHRVTYRYVPTNSCALVEKCVSGSGWRHLLMFPTGDLNTGAKSLDIGKVDYFHTEGGSLLADHGVYEFSACHHHYHFSHYGSFTLGKNEDAITHKQGFCLQPTSRLMNHELSPLNHPYSNCIDQGVAVGWLDEYTMGLECQWLDVTKVKPKVLPISFTTNPDGMMCEGTRQFDAKGHQRFEPTKFKTTDGKEVDRPLCEFFPDWAKNNTVGYDVQIPANGESYVTEACHEGVFGPLRNCGLQKSQKLVTCEPGATVGLNCKVPQGSPLQIVRLCEASKALHIGLPCTYSDALATAIVATSTDVQFTCPNARDAIETGGSYGLLKGALLPERPVVDTNCTTIAQLSFKRRQQTGVTGRIDVDDPIVTGISDKTTNQVIQRSLADLEIPLRDWLQTPTLNERSTYERRCSPLTINRNEIQFQCVTQTIMDGNTPPVTVTTTHQLPL